MQKFEHGGDLKKIMAQENLDKIIDFSANINPYGLSKNIKKANLNTFWTQMIILVDYKDILIKVFDIGIVLFFY